MNNHGFLSVEIAACVALAALLVGFVGGMTNQISRVLRVNESNIYYVKFVSLKPKALSVGSGEKLWSIPRGVWSQRGWYE